MTIDEIKGKYCMDKAPYVAPYYMINGKKANHMDLISFAKQHGLDPNQRKYGGVIEFAKAVAAGTHKPKKGPLSPEAISKAKAFLAAVKGPFKENA